MGSDHSAYYQVSKIFPLVVVGKFLFLLKYPSMLTAPYHHVLRHFPVAAVPPMSFHASLRFVACVNATLSFFLHPSQCNYLKLFFTSVSGLV